MEQVTCPECNGNGVAYLSGDAGAVQDCPSCGGTCLVDAPVAAEIEAEEAVEEEQEQV